MQQEHCTNAFCSHWTFTIPWYQPRILELSFIKTRWNYCCHPVKSSLGRRLSEEDTGDLIKDFKFAELEN